MCDQQSFKPQQIEVLIDQHHQYKFADVQSLAFRPVDKDFSYGFSSAAIWVKAKLDFPVHCDASSRWFLRILSPYHDRVDIYLPNEKQDYQHWVTGDQVIPSAGLGNQRLPMIELDSKAGLSQTVYLRFQSQNALVIAMDVLSEQAWSNTEPRMVFMSALIAAVIILALFFALMHILLFKRWEFVYYIVFVLSVFWIMVFIHGWHQVLWSHHFGDLIATFTLPVGALALLMLSHSMLNLRQAFPRLFKLQWGLGLAVFIWALWAIYQQSYRLSLPVSQLFVALLFISLLWQSFKLLKHTTMAKLFLVSFGFVFIAFLVRLATIHGFVEINFWTANSMNFALTAQIVLLLMTMVVHYYQEHSAKLKMKIIAEKAQDEIAKRRTFMNLFSHELMTPLSVLDAGIRNIQDDLADDDSSKRARAQKMAQVVKRMRRMVDACLCIEQFEQLKPQEKFSVPLLLAELEQEWQDLDGAERIQWPAAEHLPQCEIEGRVKPLVLALTMVVQNALKYSESACVLSLKQTLSEIWICIEDQGPGFADNVNPPRPFVRGDNVMHKSGLGMGLILVQDIVKSYQGRLDIQTLAQGSRVCLIIPCQGEVG